LAAPLEQGLRLAATLGDRRAEADFSTRLTVLDASRLRLRTALQRAERAVERATAAGSEEALVLALDGLKTVWAYLGDPERLGTVVAELEPRVRARNDTWLLQWVVFESSLVAAAESRWDDAHGLVAEALELNRLSGYPAYAGYLRAHDGWYARLAGDLDTARDVGRRAVDDSSLVDHPWWYAVAAGLMATTLVASGELDAAANLVRPALGGTASPSAGGRLRCLAALARSTRDPAAVAAATRLLDEVDCPEGQAWVIGADCHLQLAAAARDRGDLVEALRLVEPLRAPTSRAWAALRPELDLVVAHSTSSTSSAATAAPSPGTAR
jgi:hypothetical protein